MRVLVTGASGFVGGGLVRALAACGHEVRAAVRNEMIAVPGAKSVWVGDLTVDADISRAVDGIDAVIHCAARAHMMREQAAEAEARYGAENVEVTRKLARASVDAGVDRFIFVSTVKVNGETTANRPFTEDDPPAPEDPYGRSKAAAERALAELGAEKMGIVVIRPPLVYGPGVKANFRSLLGVCDTALPLPLGAARDNPRSMIFLGNLTSAVLRALTHPNASGRTYLVRDGEDASPAELVRRLRRALGRPAGLFWTPSSLIRWGARLAGRAMAAERLFGALSVDDGRIRRELTWTPPFTLDQGLAATASWFRAAKVARGG